MQQQMSLRQHEPQHWRPVDDNDCHPCAVADVLRGAPVPADHRLA